MNTLTKTTGLTILFYRTLTYILILCVGTTPFWHNVKTDPWNHYQIGIVVCSIAIMLRKKLGRWNVVLLGVGIGMIIDEVTDVLKLLGAPLPPNFRDSFQDLMLIVVSYVIFAFLVKIYERTGTSTLAKRG